MTRVAEVAIGEENVHRYATGISSALIVPTTTVPSIDTPDTSIEGPFGGPPESPLPPSEYVHSGADQPASSTWVPNATQVSSPKTRVPSPLIPPVNVPEPTPAV